MEQLEEKRLRRLCKTHLVVLNKDGTMASFNRPQRWEGGFYIPTFDGDQIVEIVNERFQVFPPITPGGQAFLGTTRQWISQSS